ncbi:MAG: hypothetical protein Q9162_001994 [Coniocarpon cinnabarinum]
MKQGLRKIRNPSSRSLPDHISRGHATLSATATTPIKSILIANRGEIAVRVSKTASDHGIRTTSIFTNPDAASEHVLSSPFTINLGDASSYLDGEKIINAAKSQGCDSIHPGRSKEIMQAAHVPCTPGYHGSIQDPSHLAEQAEKIGYPVLLKAVHGGGGKGMRIAHQAEDFLSQLESAKSEARNSFGDDTMLVEKYITRPRHVEVQIFGDKHGTVVALGERDCSIQRRHQKIIEESPAPGLSDAQREDLWSKAIEAGKAVNYVGAGTVEFILDSDVGDFYFMEMNTRLQVEHPVTEMCTGLDLVEWQIRVARGEPIPLTQAQIEARIAERGHAVEARIYAEDPEMDFLPTAGTLTHLKLPLESDGSVRIDTAIKEAPTTISSHYDPMISKLIVSGPDRETALRKMQHALERYEVAGLTTNVEFLKQLCLNPSFAVGTPDLDTGFIGKHHTELFSPRQVPPEVWVQAALALQLRECSTSNSSANEVFGFGEARIGSNAYDTRFIKLAIAPKAVAAVDAEAPHKIMIQQTSHGAFNASLEFTTTSASSQTEPFVFPQVKASLASTNNPQTFILSTFLPNTRLTSTVVFPSPSHNAEYKPVITIFDRGTRYDLTIPPPAWLSKALGKSTSSANEASVTAPMPSKILRVETEPGKGVRKDQPLVVVESMKMEMVIRAPKDGLIVKRVPFKAGDICKAGATLVEFEDQAQPRETSSSTS